MEITLTEAQSEVFSNPSRFRCVSAGRRWGKSYFAMFSMLYQASIPKSKIYYVTTSYRAARSIIWDDLKEALWPSQWIDKINEADLTIRLKNGSQITLRGSDNPDSLRGVGLSMVVLDECAFMEKRVWTEVIRPALSDTAGSALFISSPSGRNWFYDLWKLGMDGEKGWSSFQFTTLEGGNVPAEEIEYARRELDEKTFRQEYEAKFETYSGIVYYNFDNEESILNREYQKGKTIYIGMDFNRDPMSAIIAQKEGDKLYIIDEIIIYSSNTDEMADEIRFRYPIGDCIIYPDPAGIQKRTSAGGKTDINILQNAGYRVRHRSHHPFVRDRINSVNSRLKSSDGTRHLFVHPKCKTLIESLTKMTYKPETSIPDKTSGYDHSTDALGYMCFSGDQKVLTKSGSFKFSELPKEGEISVYNGRWAKYICAQKTGNRYCIELILASGKKIICTPEHRILTVHGFAEAQDCRIGEMLSKVNKDYKPPKPSEREVREDLDDFLEDLPFKVKQSMCGNVIVEKKARDFREFVYCLYVPRWHLFQLECGVFVSNCEYLHPVKREGKSVKRLQLSGL